MAETKKTPQERVESLERDIIDTREEFNDRLLGLESELFSLREAIQMEEMAVEESLDKVSTAFENTEAVSVAEISSYPSEESIEEKIALTDEHSSDLSESLVDTASDWNNAEPAKPSEPHFINVFLKRFITTILLFVLDLLTFFISPLQGLTKKLYKLYQHYKEQGKAPVFLMTVAGLLTLTVGFGYLLQYSFHTVFNDTLKAITGFVIGAAIIAAGALLSRKKTYFREYAASVVALGVIFNYLTAYFIGPYYGIVSESTGFIVLMSVTVISFVLAIIYETKVGSFVTLVGGVFMPLVMGDVNSLGLVFLSYLFVLSAGNLYLSYKIRWPALARITFVLSLSIIEYIGISQSINPVLVMSLLTGFFYMYVYNGSFQGVKVRESLTRYDLTLLVSNVFYFIYAMLNVSVESQTLAGVLLLHAVLLVLVVRALHLLKTTVAPIYLLMIGLLIATSAFVLAPVDISSLIWAAEGLVLLYIGFKYKHKLIRAEGYAIYLIAMFSLLGQLITTYPMGLITAFSWYWFILLAFGVLSFASYRLIGSYKDHATPLENKVAYVQNEIFTFWGVVSISLAIGVYLNELLPVLTVIPMLWCFYRVSKHQLKFAEIVGFSFFIGFVTHILMGMVNTNSAVITQQSYQSWIVLVEMLFFAWALKYYYLHFNIVGRGKTLALMLHQMFFYVPLVLLVMSLLQINIQYIVNGKPLGFDFLWFDYIVVASLLVLAHWLVNKSTESSGDKGRLKQKTLLMETTSLYLTSFFLFTIVILFNEWMFNAVAVPLLFLLYRGVKTNLALTEKLAWAHFILFAIMTLIAYETVGNLHFSEQSLSTQIAWVEVLLCAWVMKSIYQRLASEGEGFKAAAILRTSVYLLIPVIFMPRVLRLYAEFLPAFVWLSFLISWLMYKKLKISPLLLQLVILFFVALVTTTLSVIDAVTSPYQIPALVSLSVGVVVVSLFHIVEKSLFHTENDGNGYKGIRVISPYFYALSIAAFCYAFTGMIVLSIFLSTIFLMYLVISEKFINVMKDSIKQAHLLVWSGLIAVPMLVFMQLEQSKLIILIDLLSILVFWYMTHKQQGILTDEKKVLMTKKAQYWVFHCLLFVTYTGILNLLFKDWSVGTSIAMLMHAVIVLFLTLNDEFKPLLRLSVVLYALTAAKVIFHDMNDFSHIHKVIALMCMGSILMLAAYLFQKAKNSRTLSAL